MNRIKLLGKSVSLHGEQTARKDTTKDKRRQRRYITRENMTGGKTTETNNQTPEEEQKT